ncbi:SRPBCC family protein [Lysinibacillus cavernae]|uniref:SRPBCC family protein n=1 Tax=Lysinibacillus cavernae TaxID=2666135 RepID=UPI0012D9B5B6|nr:SRPBCC domain-containing protein [Lysinibacillus cavernae]
MDNQRIIGQTKSVGYQVGVRRTFPISQEQAWALITTEEGLNSWLGEVTHIILQPGQTYHSKAGTGEIRIVKPLQQLRLTWQKEEWSKPSTVQVRIISKDSNKTTISFHQEHLSNQTVREEMKLYWEKVLDGIKERALNT